MKQTGLICCDESVRGILDGRKTQTRRVIKPQPVWEDKLPNSLKAAGWKWKTKKVGLSAWPNVDKFLQELVQYCPYGVVGDRLWVKEAIDARQVLAKYIADGKSLRAGHTKLKPKIHSSIFMPKWAARLWLEITNVRVERVQEITKDRYSSDIWQEGICQICDDEGIRYDSDPLGEPPQHCGGNGGMGCFADYKDLFRELWDSLNAKRGYSWELNPYVWVLEFKRLQEKPE